MKDPGSVILDLGQRLGKRPAGSAERSPESVSLEITRHFLLPGWSAAGQLLARCCQGEMPSWPQAWRGSENKRSSLIIWLWGLPPVRLP